jgi:hypothetical protein
MKFILPCVLTINRGSSRIRFAIFAAGKNPRRRPARKIARPEDEPMIARLVANCAGIAFGKKPVR